MVTVVFKETPIQNAQIKKGGKNVGENEKKVFLVLLS